MKLSYKSFLLTLALKSVMSVQSRSLRGGESEADIPMEMSMEAIESQDEFLEKSLGVTIPYHNSCELGSGLNFEASRCGAVAIKDLQFCDQSSGTSSCINIDEAMRRVTAYSHTSTSFQDTSDLMNTVARAEGSYGPFSGSVGADYLRESAQSTNSFSFFIGQSVDWKRHHLTNVRNLQLTDAAFQLLQNDAAGFVELFGRSFIHNINYGASFLGSATLRSLDSTSTESLEAFAKIQVDKGIFSASGSVDFNTARSEASGSLDIRMDARHTGSSQLIAFPTTDPKEMADYYNDWWSNVNVNTVNEMSMNTVDYLQLQQVTDYIATIPDAVKRSEVRRHLIGEPLTQSISDEVLREELKGNAVMNTLTATERMIGRQDVSCSNLPDDAARILRNMRFDVSSHQTNVERMTYEDFLTVQFQVASGNNEFFKADEFSWELDALIRGWDCTEPERVAFPNPAGVVHKFRATKQRNLPQLPLLNPNAEVCVVAQRSSEVWGRMVLDCAIDPTRGMQEGVNRANIILETNNNCEVEITGVLHWARDTPWGGHRIFFFAQVIDSEETTLRKIRECFTPGTEVVGYWEA